MIEDPWEAKLRKEKPLHWEIYKAVGRDVHAALRVVECANLSGDAPKYVADVLRRARDKSTGVQ